MVKVAQPPSEMSRQRQNHLLYKSFKGGILKITSVLLPLRSQRANEETFQCLFYLMNLESPSFLQRHYGPDVSGASSLRTHVPYT